MRNFVLIFFIGFIQSLFSQIGMGEWRLHVTSAKALDVAVNETTVYTAFENGLYVLDLSNGEEKSMMNAINGLSDIQISCLFWDEIDQSLFIGYANGNIDKLKNNRVYNIPAIRLASVPNSKKINRFERNGDFIYVATDFAVSQLNPIKNEIKDTYYPTNSLEKISDIAFSNDTIYALSPTRLLFGKLNNPALPDFTQWTTDLRLNAATNPNFYHELEAVNGNLYVLYSNPIYGNDSVYKLTATGKQLLTSPAFSLEINSINQIENLLSINIDGGFYLYNSSNNQVGSYITNNLGVDISPSRTAKNSLGIWSSDLKGGLFKYASEIAIKNYPISGTKNTSFYSMDWRDGKLAIASGRLLLRLPSFSRNGVHLFEDENWELKSESNVAEWQGKDLWDILDVSINPKNTKEFAVSTYSKEPLTIFKEDSVLLFDESNSTLKLSGINNGWSLVSDVCYDEKGNLWALNGYADKPLNVRDKNGVWKNFDCGLAARNIFTTKMIVDFKNIIWFASLEDGMFGYDYSGTLDDASDDRYIHISTGTLTGDLPSKNVTALAADFDGEIWVGTDAGFGILYSAANSFDAEGGDYNVQRVKVQFEGNVEYVLGNTHITDIEVDGGNRKWVATANAGVLLLSADGSEILEQYTMSNSPLISDNVFDIKLDQKTGELYIITDKGLVSVRTNASYEDPEYSDVVVFPNPVRPNYFGPITMQGLRYNSDVKITDVAGNLVYKTTSNGGTATWDGKTLDGQKAATGVYLIWTATNEGNDKKVGKVLVVK
jgi:hypothetical protein